MLLSTALLCGVAPLWADDVLLSEVRVSTPQDELLGSADSAGEGHISAQQLRTRPLLRAAEVLEAVPGMVVTQHSGDGKANQYFLRGFNLDHGSDFATTLLGMPVNMVSHAHGQGYMDLNFLIPELVERVDFRKGGSGAQDGNFAVSGSADIHYARAVPSGFTELTAGAHQYRRAVLAQSQQTQDLSFLSAFEWAGNNGPWTQPENLHKQNAVLRLSSGQPLNGFSLSALFYQSNWLASEHVPERAISSAEISRYGTLSPRDGGQTHRYSLSGEWASTGPQHSSRAHAYLINYSLNLFSAPSGYITGLQGDQHEQADQRWLWGGGAQRSLFLGQDDDTELTVGGQWRQDRIGQLGLYTTENRVRTQTIREDRVTESALGLFAEVKKQWQPWLRSRVAGRYDYLSAHVTPLAGTFNATNGGTVAAGQFSPKLGVVLGPWSWLGEGELYANLGRSFHSNDVRGATSRVNPQNGDPVTPVPLLVRASGAEIGLRLQPQEAWRSTLSLWRMSLASELVFIGDEGVTEPKGASTRHGLEWTNQFRPTPGWQVHADLALSQARFDQASNGGTHVPNAIPLVASFAIHKEDHSPWFGGVRVRYLGAYDLEETGTQKSQAFWIANLRLGYKMPTWQWSLDVLNLFNKQANDIEYWGGACTRNEGPNCGGSINPLEPSGIDGRLIHPLEPRSARLTVRINF